MGRKRGQDQEEGECSRTKRQLVSCPFCVRTSPDKDKMNGHLKVHVDIFNDWTDYLKLTYCITLRIIWIKRYWNVVIASLGQVFFSSILDTWNSTFIHLFSFPYKVLHRLTTLEKKVDININLFWSHDVYVISRQPFLRLGLNTIWQNYKTVWNGRSLNAPKELEESL